jgi:hypothetical protein
MPTGYYKGFSVCKIGTSGHREDLPGLTIAAYNTTTSSSLGNLTVNTFSSIDEGSFAADPGDIVRFSHATYPETFTMTLAETQAEAYTDPRNNVMTFVVEDLFTDTDESTGDIYALDLDNPEKGLVYIGSVKSGITNEIPYSATTDQPNLRLFAVTKDGSGKYAKNQLGSVVDLANAEFVDVSVAGVKSSLKNTPPATSSSAGVTGTITYDATHIYVCVATNTWVRASLATF